MRLISAILLAGLGLAARGAQTPPPTPAPGPAHVLTYLEILPGSAGRVPAALKQYRDATRREAGNVAVEVLQRRERANQFAILETWTDQMAFDAHTQAAHVTRLQETLRPLQIAPPDQRQLREVSNGPARQPIPGNAWYVLTHADALPPASRGVDALKPLAEASRAERDNLRFDVLNQPTRQNHFTIVEVWESEGAINAHAAAAHTRRFRDQFQLITGSLYDERFYKRID